MVKLHHLHDWSVSITEAQVIQHRLASFVVTQDDFATPIAIVAGVDVGFEDGFNLTRAAVVVLSFPDLVVLETAIAYVLACTTKYRLPETTRLADKLASQK